MQRNNNTTKKDNQKARPRQSNQQNSKKKKSSSRQPSTQNLLGLSSCVLKYATAISDPWSPESAGACIPTFPSRPSQKLAVFCRTTCVIGTGNLGAIGITPCLANNFPTIYCTNGTYVNANSLNVTNATGATIPFLSHNGPYAGSDLTSGSETDKPAVSGRIVSVGVSVQYTGTKLNEGGLIRGLVEPDHGNLNGYTYSYLGGYRECYVATSGSRKHWFTLSGQTANEVEYPNSKLAYASTDILNQMYPFANGVGLDSTQPTIGGFPLLIYVTGVPGNTFEVELIMHVEYIGQMTSPSATPSHSDAQGFQVVNTASQMVQSLATANPNTSRPVLMRQAIVETLKSLRPVASFAMKALRNPMVQSVAKAGVLAIM